MLIRCRERRTLVLASLFLVAPPLFAQRLNLSAAVTELESQLPRESTDPGAHHPTAAYWSENRFDDAERSLMQTPSLDHQ